MSIPLVPWFQALKNWLFAVFSHDRPSAASNLCASGARVIEFHVPESFQARQRAWLPAEARGKLIEFSAHRVKKSA